MLADKVRSMRGAHWLAMFGAILASWTALYAMAIPEELRAASRLFGSEFWVALCTVSPDLAGYGRTVVMWVLMTTAMMLPTALRAFATYDDIAQTKVDTAPAALIQGFLVVWWGFAVVAAALQIVLAQADLLGRFGASQSTWFSAALLAFAGLYQFSALKEACLSKCRAPLMLFLAHWHEGAWRMGLRLGLMCLGCCWALMLLAFVGGVTSLAVMGIATLMMILEKLPQIGRWMSRPLGFALLGGAGWIAASGL